MSYNSEPDDIKICPYDKSHRILAYRFQTHLIKCAKVKQHKPDPFLPNGPFLSNTNDIFMFHFSHIQSWQSSTRCVHSMQRIASWERTEMPIFLSVLIITWLSRLCGSSSVNVSRAVKCPRLFRPLISTPMMMKTGVNPLIFYFDQEGLKIYLSSLLLEFMILLD